jgi:hypothetical protein
MNSIPQTFQIKHINGSVLFETQAETLKVACELAIKQKVSLTGAYLTCADLTGADLTCADLTGADLTGAYLTGANIRYTNLRGADLRGADIRYTNLRGACLTSAYLTGADLTGADLPDYSVCPQDGEFIAWKKVQGNVVLKLRIPADAKRTSNLRNRKCRAEFVDVLAAYDRDKHELPAKQEFEGIYNTEFKYCVGQRITPDSYNDDIREDCTSGIHFFITRKEAEAWS